MKSFKFSIQVVCCCIQLIISCENSSSQANNSGNKLQRIEAKVLSLLTISDSTEQYELTLCDKNDTLRKLPMIIGKNEAQTLAITLENLNPTMPLPLDLLEDVIKKFGYSVTEIVIDSLINEVYTSKIICQNKKKTIELRARTSDAVTIASKFNCPIFIAGALFNQ